MTFVLFATRTCGRRRSGRTTGILIRHEQLVGLHERRARLVGLVVDVQHAQRGLVGELVLAFERVHVSFVDQESGADRVRVEVLVRRDRSVDRLGRPLLENVEADLADRRMVQRDDRVREEIRRWQSIRCR
jgi:hypothetical protein